MTINDLPGLTEHIREFARVRDWEQFHTPKNLAMALSGEVGELTALFQWLTPSESATAMADDELAFNITDEVADVLIYLIRLADVLDIDLLRAAADKIDRNETRFPAVREE